MSLSKMEDQEDVLLQEAIRRSVVEQLTAQVDRTVAAEFAKHTEARRPKGRSDAVVKHHHDCRCDDCFRSRWPADIYQRCRCGDPKVPKGYARTYLCFLHCPNHPKECRCAKCLVPAAKPAKEVVEIDSQDEDVPVAALAAAAKSVEYDSEKVTRVFTQLWQMAFDQPIPDGWIDKNVPAHLKPFAQHIVSEGNRAWHYLDDHLPLAQRLPYWVSGDLAVSALAVAAAEPVLDVAAFPPVVEPSEKKRSQRRRVTGKLADGTEKKVNVSKDLMTRWLQWRLNGKKHWYIYPGDDYSRAVHQPDCSKADEPITSRYDCPCAKSFANQQEAEHKAKWWTLERVKTLWNTQGEVVLNPHSSNGTYTLDAAGIERLATTYADELAEFSLDLARKKQESSRKRKQPEPDATLIKERDELKQKLEVEMQRSDHHNELLRREREARIEAQEEWDEAIERANAAEQKLLTSGPRPSALLRKLRTPDKVQGDKDPLACIVCMEHRHQVVLLPCGHRTMCGPCAQRGGYLSEQPGQVAATKPCPTCREPCLDYMLPFDAIST
jgi:hypothetical protein